MVNEPDHYPPVYGNNIRLAIGCAAVAGIGLLVVVIYFGFRALTYPGW